MHLAHGVGLSKRAAWEVATSIAELVSNAVRHAGGGELEVRIVTTPRRALEVVVRDHGPGLEDVELAVRDGWSEGRWLVPGEPNRKGLGVGLGAVMRLMNETKFEVTDGGGTTVISRKWFA